MVIFSGYWLGYLAFGTAWYEEMVYYVRISFSLLPSGVEMLFANTVVSMPSLAFFTPLAVGLMSVDVIGKQLNPVQELRRVFVEVSAGHWQQTSGEAVFFLPKHTRGR